MSILETTHQRKSFALTTVILILLVLLMFIAGMSYLVPPPESGIAVNFGYVDAASGDIQTSQPKPTVPNPQTAPPKTNPEPEKTIEATQEKVLTQDVEESVAIPVKEVKKKVETPKVVEKKAVEETKKEVPKPTVSQSTTDALNNMLKGGSTSGNDNSNSDGDKTGTGDQGNPNGSKDAKGYYGNSATGTGGNYQLGDRGALTKPKPKYLCNEEGTVVVRVDVDRDGKVTYAQYEPRGSNNNAACLVEQAKIAALATKWQPKADAPNLQSGFIIYSFSLVN